MNTSGDMIVNNDGLEVNLNCANWKGSQMETYVPYGLDKAPIDYIAKSISAFGFNCVRLPYSLELFFDNPIIVDENVSKNSELKGL